MDHDEFLKLAMAELEPVHRLAYHLAHRPGEADDMVQETYVRAFKSSATYRPGERGIRPWLFKILHNVINTRISAEHRQREVLDGLQQEPAVRHDSAAAPTDVARIDWDAIDERLKAAIQDLSLPHRTVFLLCAVEGLSYREIADVTESPIGTVMSRLFRARTILAERLAVLAAERGLGRGEKEANQEISGSS